MPRTRKRRAAAPDPAEGKRRKTGGAGGGRDEAPRPYFVIAAGAGGTLPSDKAGEPPRSIKTLLAAVGDVDGPVLALRGGAGCGPANLARYQDYVEAACAGAAAGRKVYLVGQSFGGRCGVHLWQGGVEERKPPCKPTPWDDKRPMPSEVRGMIAFGYPLHHAKQDRGAPLRELEPGTPVLFVMGERDKVALGPSLDKAVLTDVIDEMPAKETVQVHWVPRAGHNPLDAPKSIREESNDAILEAVRAFVGA